MVEILVVLGLIALAGGLIVINANAFLRGLGAEPPEETFRKAVREARFQAAYHQQTVRLSYERDEATLRLEADSASDLPDFPLDRTADASEYDIQFEQFLPFEGLSPQRNADTAPTPNLYFRPDRSSTPFQVRFDIPDQNFSQQYDPFSAIVISDSRNDPF